MATSKTGGSIPVPYSTKDMYFPSTLGTYPYTMTLNFYVYSVPSFYIGPSSQTTAILSGTGSITLPLPNYMVDSQLVAWDQQALGLALGMGLNAAGQAGGGLGSLGAFAKSVLQGSLYQGAVNAGAAVGSLIPDSQGRAVSALSAVTGMAINPFMTVMFKTPAFKKHTLSWKFSPVNAQDSQTLNSIISTLRYNQLPGVSSDGALLTYPNVLQIVVSNTMTNQNYFSYVFKPTVIEACGVNYTPSGQPAFFNGTNAPTEVEISLSLLEIELWLQKDYGTPTGPNQAQQTTANIPGLIINNVTSAASAVGQFLIDNGPVPDQQMFE